MAVLATVLALAFFDELFLVPLADFDVLGGDAFFYDLFYRISLTFSARFDYFEALSDFSIVFFAIAPFASDFCFARFSAFAALIALSRVNHP